MRAGGVNFDAATGQPLLQNFGQAANYGSGSNMTTTTTSAPAGGMSNLQAGQMAGAIGGAVSGLAQMAGNICSYVYGQRVQDAQYDMQTSQLEHKAASAALTRDSQMATADTQSESIKIQAEGQALNNKALEKRKKCEDAVVVEKAKKQQHELTKKAAKGKFSKAAIRRLFNDPRASYANGQPVR